MKQSEKKTGKLDVNTVLFDLDGTLIDTEPTAAEAIRICLKEWKIQLEDSDATYVTGRTWESVLDFLFKKYTLPMSKADANEEIVSIYRKKLKETLHVVPGSVSAVQSLAEKYPLGLVSGSLRKEILWVLEELKILRHFQIVLGAEDYPRSKPNPDGYLKAIQHFGVAPTSCLIFEDSTAGLTSARTVGAWVVAVTSTNHFNQDISLAHFRVPDLTQVNVEWVKNLSFD